MKRDERVIEILEMALKRVAKVAHDRHSHLGDSCPKCIADTALERAARVPPDL